MNSVCFWCCFTKVFIDSMRFFPVKRVHFFNITPNNRHRLSKVTYGDCSISTMPQFNDLTKINQHKHLQIKSKMGNNTAYLAFNIHAPPLNQKEIRRAIAIAINKPDILSHIYSNFLISLQNCSC